MQFLSFIHVFPTLHSIVVVPDVFLGQIPNEFEPANAVITFGLMLREYIQERSINLKLAFHFYRIKVRVA